MVDHEVINSIVGFLAILSTFAVYRLNLARSRKVRADLLDRFEKALDCENKHTVGELFYMLHGLRMDYEDIKTICDDNKFSKIIYALKKTPGMVEYENGCFQYTKLFEIEWFRRIDEVAMKLLAYGLGFVTAAMAILLVFADGIMALVITVALAIVAYTLNAQINDIHNDNTIDSLVHQKEVCK